MVLLVSHLAVAFAAILYIISTVLTFKVMGKLEVSNARYYYDKAEAKKHQVQELIYTQWSDRSQLDYYKQYLRDNFLGEKSPDFSYEMGNVIINEIERLDVTGMAVIELDGDMRQCLYIRKKSQYDSTDIKSTLRKSYEVVSGEQRIVDALFIDKANDWKSSLTYEDEDYRQLFGYAARKIEELNTNVFIQKMKIDGQESLVLTSPVYSRGKLRALISMELSENRMTELLSSEEYGEEGEVLYSIATRNQVFDSFTNQFAYNEKLLSKFEGPVHFRKSDNIDFGKYDDYVYNIDEYVAIVLPLNIKTGASGLGNWHFIAYVPEESVNSGSNVVQLFFGGGTTVMLLVGIFVALLFSWRLAKPLKTMANQTEVGDLKEGFIVEEYSQINKELDQLLEEISDGNSRLSYALQLLGTKMIIIEQDIEDDIVKKYGHGGKYVDAFLDENVTWPMNMNDFSKMVERFFSMVENVETREDRPNQKIYTVNVGDTLVYMQNSQLVTSDKIVQFFTDITDEVLEDKKQNYENEFDTLTQLPNRETFIKNVTEYISQSAGLTKGAIVIWQLEYLKFINEMHGYIAGDNYIKDVAEVLSEMQGADVMVGKYSSKSFVTYIPYDHMRDKVIGIIEEYSRKLSKLTVEVAPGKRTGIKFRKGISWYPGDSKSIRELCRYAAYAAGDETRGPLADNRQFSPESFEAYLDMMITREYLDRLVEKNDVLFMYQPLIEIENLKVTGYEALMKPLSKELNYVEDVLRYAQIHSKGYEIEAMVMKDVFQEMNKFKREFKGKLIFINSIGDCQIPSRSIGKIANMSEQVVIDLQDAEKLTPEQLESKVKWVRTNGFKLCLDSFGLWIGSHIVLNKYKPDFIKISRRIVHEVDKDPDKQEAIKSIVSNCQKEGITAIAVGVETTAELDYLKSIGIKYAQGFLLGAPREGVYPYYEDDLVMNMGYLA